MPVSAFAARKARQQQQQEDAATTVNKALELESHGEPPSKKARRLSEEEMQPAGEEDTVPKTRASSRRKKDVGKNTEKPRGVPKTRGQAADSRVVQEQEDQVPSYMESEIEQTSVAGENNDDTVASVNGDADG